jgi:hypothetical protein
MGGEFESLWWKCRSRSGLVHLSLVVMKEREWNPQPQLDVEDNYLQLSHPKNWNVKFLLWLNLCILKSQRIENFEIKSNIGQTNKILLKKIIFIKTCYLLLCIVILNFRKF